MIGTVVRADVVDLVVCNGRVVQELYNVTVVWDPAERLFGKRCSKDEVVVAKEAGDACSAG